MMIQNSYVQFADAKEEVDDQPSPGQKNDRLKTKNQE